MTSIMLQVFLSGDSAVEDAGLIALQAVVKAISTGVAQVPTFNIYS